MLVSDKFKDSELCPLGAEINRDNPEGFSPLTIPETPKLYNPNVLYTFARSGPNNDSFMSPDIATGLPEVIKLNELLISVPGNS